ncbi:hypothetical protein F7731_17330 [Cytobacillus depressus]|uniref:Uncharacterized protein n=1 Tax=Cytobacillus depressus TaxID=1602942 RepID=A0A6L3V4C3_9BACI|nr:hypothetical protein [Cytobacillus depressus]KAB2332323.1 hypothetical protein F7731_17330 [Cytobacillus depressus]
MAILFIGFWLGLTIPTSLSVVFWVLEPIVNQDTTGVSMIIITLLVGFIDVYIGIKIFEMKVQPFLEKRKKKKHFP